MKGPKLTGEQKAAVLGDAAPVNGVLLEKRALVTKAMHGLCDGLGALAQVRDAMDAAVSRLPPGHEDELLALGITRAVNHLVEAAADVPEAMWAIMAAEGMVGGEEIKGRFEGLLARARRAA